MQETSQDRPKPRFALPDAVRAQILCNGTPTGGLFLWALIHTSFKNDFASLFGPSDGSGFVAFTRDDLLLNGERDRNLFLMDYGHPEIDYTGHMEVVAANREDLRRAVDAYHMFQQVVSFPPRHAEVLQEARLKLEALAPASLTVTLWAEGGTGRVVTLDAQA